MSPANTALIILTAITIAAAILVFWERTHRK